MLIPVFDLHCDTADRLSWQSLPAELKAATGQDFYGPGDDANPTGCTELAHNHCMISIEKTGAVPWVQCLACYIPDCLTPEQSVAFYKHVRAYAGEQLAKNGAVVITRASQIRSVLEGDSDALDNAPATSRFAGVATIENARLFAADSSLVEKLAAQDLLMASLSWNAAGPLASGHDTHQGLTKAGKQVLAEMERCGVIMDVSHLNDEGFDEVAKLTSRPFVASHSNARAVCSHKRNLTDEQFRIIAERGGVVGLNYCSGFIVDGAWGERAASVTYEQLAAHIEHWLELGGEDALALGGDWDGADMPSFLADASCMPAFQDMLTHSFGETIVRKLCYANALRFFEEFGN